MKHKLQTLLKHNWRTLLLLLTLITTSQGVLAETQSLFSIRVYYNKSEHFYNVSRWSSTCTNPDNNPCNTDQTSWVSSNGTTNLGEVTGHIYLRGYIWLDYTDERSNGYVSWKTDKGSFTQKNMSKKGDYNNWCSNNWYRYETDSGSDFDINTDNLTPGEHTIEFYARSPWYNNDAYHNNDGNNYKIKFTVPEPAATFAEGDVIWLDIRHSNGGWGQETGELMYVNLNPGDNTITRAMTKVAQADNTVKNSLWVYRFTAADAALNKSEIKFQRGNASDGRWNKSTGLSASDLSSNNGIYIDDSTWDGAGKKFNFTTSNNIVSTPTLTMKDNAGSSTISSCTSGETVKFYESTQTITTTISGTSKARTLVNPLYTYTFSKGSYSSGQTIDNPHSWTTGDTYLGSGTAKVKITFAIDGSSTPASSISSGYEKESSGTSFTVNSSCTTPTPTTSDTPSAYSYTTATLTGTYPTTSSYCAVTKKGICYGTSSNPTTKYPDTTSGSGSISYSATGLNDNTTYHYRAYVEAGGTTYYGADKTFTTTACSAPTISTQPYNTATRRYCINTETPAKLTVAATGGVGSYTYQWQQRNDGSDTFTNVTTGTGYQTASFTPSNATSGNRYYRCIVTNKDVCTSNSVTSNESCKYTINRLSASGTLSGDGTYCQGASGDTQTLTLTDYVGSRQWHKSTTSDFTPTNDTKISGATGTTYNAPINTTGTMYYKVVVTNGACSSATTDQAAVTVDPYPTITAQPTASQSVCVGSTASSISVTATGTGLSYQWQSKAGENWVDWADKTSSTLTFGAIPYASTWIYRCKITASCGAIIYSDTHTITGVASASITSVTLSSSPVCKGQGLSATANGVVLGGGTGAWSSSNTIVATVASTGVITPKAAGSTNITYTITGGCGGTVSKYATLTVKPNAAAAQYTLTNKTQTYNGAPRAVTVTPAEGAGTATIYYTGTGSTSYAKSTTAPINAGTYAITVNAASGTNYCAASDLSVGTLTVNKANQSTLTISNTATDLVYCDAANVKLTTSGGSGDGAVTYTVTSGSGSVDGDVLSPSAKGSVTVVADKAASANYKGIKSAAKTFNFNVNAPTVYTLSNVGGATTICGDPSTGAGSGTLRLANSQTGYNYQLYSNGSPVEGYAAKAGTTGSSIDFPVTSSGTYTVYGYYGSNSSNCPTQMDGEITLTISTQPRLVRSAAIVSQYTPVTITCISTDIETWEVTNAGSTAYLYDQTYNSVDFKGASTNSPYTITATTKGGCSETTTITVNTDHEDCN